MTRSLIHFVRSRASTVWLCVNARLSRRHACTSCCRQPCRNLPDVASATETKLPLDINSSGSNHRRQQPGSLDLRSFSPSAFVVQAVKRRSCTKTTARCRSKFSCHGKTDRRLLFLRSTVGRPPDQSASHRLFRIGTGNSAIGISRTRSSRSHSFALALDPELVHGLQRLVVFLAESHVALGGLELHAFHGGDQLLGIGAAGLLDRSRRPRLAAAMPPAVKKSGGSVEALRCSATSQSFIGFFGKP